MSSIGVQPLNEETPSLGAVLQGVNLEALSDQDFDIVRDALYRYSVICIKSSNKLPPHIQAELTRRFDPSAQSYGHGKTIDAKRSILHPDLKTIPHQPEVQVIGNGSIDEYEGLKNIKLKHPHHKTFHKTSIPAEKDLDYTRFYRWHIDAALYGPLNPPMVTSLLAVSLPEKRTQTLLYDEAGKDTLPVPLGTTAFVSGYTLFQLLTSEQKAFVLTSKIEYAPHPYIWISSAKSRAEDGVWTCCNCLGTKIDLPHSKEVLCFCVGLSLANQDRVSLLELDGKIIRYVHLDRETNGPHI